MEFDDKFQEMRERFRNFTGIEQVDVPKAFKGELRDYQRDGLSWMTFLNEFHFGGCLADDMGLGKTVQYIAMLMKHRETHKKAPPSLIVVPRSLIFNWKNECERFGPKLKVMNYTGMERAALRDDGGGDAAGRVPPPLVVALLLPRLPLLPPPVTPAP